MRVDPPGFSADHGSQPHAGELFTDRERESQAFEAALAGFRRLIDRDDTVGDARNNVVTFYGLGGIGKTALSERLEAWVRRDLPLLNGWGTPPETRVDASARIDLHGSAGRIDMTVVLVALRAGVAGIRRHWPVFDLAFAAYWSAVRPGEPLPNLRGDRDEYGAVVADTTAEILKDLGSAAEYVVGTPVGLGVWGVRKVVGILRRRHSLRLGIAAFAGFEDFLMRCADEPSPTESRPDLACQIAACLSWELASITPSPLLTIFVDTVERLALDPRRTSEGHLNRLVHAMPNVLFVLTGREMLDWYDESRVDLPHRGSWIWPDLVPGAPEARQHRVHSLSPSDTRTLIQRGRSQLDLPMSDTVVDELVIASSGLPQYLELARQVAISVKDAKQGRQVQISDVTGSLSSLVMRILDDVPADEQRAIRAACLFRAFDTELVAAAADVDRGCAERAVSRPMIDRNDGERFPYRMHDAVREAIRRTNHQVAGGWAEPDWEQAASRAAVAARRIHDNAKNHQNNREVPDAIGIAIGLVCEQNTALGPSARKGYADWLSQAIVYSPSVPGLRSRVPATSRTDYGRVVLNFVAAKSLDTPADERVRLLREIFSTDHPLCLVAGRHLGYALKALYRWDEALEVFDEVARRRPSPVNLAQRPQVLDMTRRFVDARDAAAGIPVQATITRVRQYAHGRPERYFAEIGDRLAKMRDDGRQREYLEELGDFVVRRAFFRGDVDLAEVNDFRDEAEFAGHTVAMRSALFATVLVRPTDPAEISTALDQLRTLDVASGPGEKIGFRYAFAEFCDAQLTDDGERLLELRKEADLLEFRNRSWIPVECFLDAAGLPLRPLTTQWFEPYSVVRERWVVHLRSYLARHRGS